jgi:nucleoside-diphosphate-sugar epimerase
MKIVITGALGHIGSYLIRELPAYFPDAEIIMMDNMMTQRYSSLFNLPSIGKYTFLEGDVIKADLENIFDSNTVVVHLAAITDAAGSFGNAEAVEKNNFVSTTRVAEACVATGAKLITLSSTSVYGTQASRVSEDCTEDELQPQSPYATTKLKEEKLIRELCENKKLRAVTFRFGTIFGASAGMRYHTAVNKFCWQAVLGQPITVWSTAFHQMRPYLDLQDAVRSICHFITTDRFDGRIYNVVTKNATVSEIVDAIKQFVPDLQVNFVDSKIMNQLSYEVDYERVLSTGFVPAGNLNRGIGETISLLMNASSSANRYTK